MAEGRLLWLNEETGYGLIRPDDGGRNLFVHPTELGLGEAIPLYEGAEVAYKVKQGRTMRATNVVRRPSSP